MKQTFLAALVIISLAAALAAPQALAFNPNTRMSILKDAIQFAPENLRAYLLAREDVVEDGMVYNFQGAGFISPLAAGQVYGTLVSRLQGAGVHDYNTYRGFGILAALVTESLYPGSRFTSLDIKPDKVLFDGVQEVGDPALKVDSLIATYSPYWKDNRREVTAVLYDHAVNAVVDMLTAAWTAGGNEPGAAPEVGSAILHMNQVLADEALAKAAGPALGAESGDAAQASPGASPMAAALGNVKAALDQQIGRSLPSFLPSQPTFK